MKAIKTLLPVLASLIVAEGAFAQTWTQTSAPTNYWSCVAGSADGTKLVAAIDDGYTGMNNIYTSTNSGTTWMLTSAPTNYSWDAVASSADGNKLVVAAFSSVKTGSKGAIFVSTNSGTTWALTSAATTNYWISVASSADGNKWAAVSDGGIYTTTNLGATWTHQTSAPNFGWGSIISSPDGTRLLVQTSAHIYRSTDSGATWTPTTLPIPTWLGVSSQPVIASSADGTKLVATFNTDQNFNACPIFISTNLGTTWSATSTLSNHWTCVASSADGTKFVAAAVNSQNIGPIYTSTNSGATWTSNTVPNQYWTCVAFSADGNKLVAVSGRYILGQIFTTSFTPNPSINITRSSSNLGLSWLVPSTNFVLQQSADLASWSNVTNLPLLNLTNLQNQVALPPSGSSGFYRLKTQ